MPIECTGFSEVIGSWKIIEISLPRTLRSSDVGSSSRLRPLKTASPVDTVFARGFSPRMVRQVTLLPQPDSPTIASVLPFSTEKETPSTAPTMPSSVRNCVFRSRTSRSATWFSLPVWGYASRMRGSIHAYSRSTSRLNPITSTEANTVTPTILGRSNW